MILKGHVNRRRLERATVVLPIIEGQTPFDFLGPCDPLGNTVDFSLEILLSTYAATILVAHKAVGLHRRMLLRRAWTSIVLQPLLSI